jgi:DNA-binding transcriptional ArsR family regulator
VEVAVNTDPQRLDAALRALADPHRRAILELVRERPRAVGEIAGHFAITQQAVSHHLGVLESAGLASSHREGTRHLFAADPAGLDVIRAYLNASWPTPGG